MVVILLYYLGEEETKYFEKAKEEMQQKRLKKGNIIGIKIVSYCICTKSVLFVVWSLN